MKRKPGIRASVGRNSPLLQLLLLSGCFLLGVLLGRAAVEGIDPEIRTELDGYLRGFCLTGETGSAAALWTTFLLYFRYPVLAFFLGLVSVGFLLLPCLSVLYGFFLSFSVCCFTAAFGGEGLALAAAVLGLRCLISVPCYLILAVSAMGTSLSLARLSFGAGRREAPVRPSLVQAGVCAAILLLGSCLELLLGPWLLRTALQVFL